MRRFTVAAPFTDGLLTDMPPHMVPARGATRLENVSVINGIARRRKGWREDVPLAVDCNCPYTAGVFAGRFQIPSRDLTVVGTNKIIQYGLFDSSLNDIGSFPVGDPFMLRAEPRCMFHGELVLCDPLGERGLRRYAGGGNHDSESYQAAAKSATLDSGGLSHCPTISMSVSAGSREFVYTLPGSNTYSLPALDALASDVGWYVNWRSSVGKAAMPTFGTLIAGKPSSTRGTLVHVQSTGTWETVLSTVSPVGYAYPAVCVYEDGSYTSTSNTVTGHGTEWHTGGWGSAHDDPMLSFLGINAGVAYHRGIHPALTLPGSPNTTLVVPGLPDNSTQSKYMITSGLPFSDACVHRDSLVGCGVKQYRNRVYMSPQGWSMETPPREPAPLLMESNTFQDADPNYFLLDYWDVPSTDDTDPVVAVISTPGPCLVLKKRSAHGLFGDWPTISQALIHPGAGCLHRNAAVSSHYGQFWAGPRGVYRYANGSVIDLTEGRMSSTWRNLVAEWSQADDMFCALGAFRDKVFVSIGAGRNSNPETLAFNAATGVCEGFITNHPALAYNRSMDETGKFIWVGRYDPALSSVRDSAPLVTGSGRGNDANTGTDKRPVLVAETGTGLPRFAGIDGLSKIVDVSASLESGEAETVDSYAVTFGGTQRPQPESDVHLGTVVKNPSDTDVTRHRWRVGLRGRMFGARFVASDAGFTAPQQNSLTISGYSTTVGDGTSTSFTVTHGLGSKDVAVSVRETASPYKVVYAGMQAVAASANTVTLTFDTAPSSNQFTVTVIGNDPVAVPGPGQGTVWSHVQRVGDGANTSFLVNHEFNTRDVAVWVRTSGENSFSVYSGWEATAETVDAVRVTFDAVVSRDAFTVGVFGNVQGGGTPPVFPGRSQAVSFVATIGDGTSKSFQMYHLFGTRFFGATVRDGVSGEELYASWMVDAGSVDAARVEFDVPPAPGTKVFLLAGVGESDVVAPAIAFHELDFGFRPSREMA